MALPAAPQSAGLVEGAGSGAGRGRPSRALTPRVKRTRVQRSLAGQREELMLVELLLCARFWRNSSKL